MNRKRFMLFFFHFNSFHFIQTNSHFFFQFIFKKKTGFYAASRLNEKVKKKKPKVTVTENKALNLKFGIYTPHYFDLCVQLTCRRKKEKEKKKNYHSNDSTMILFGFLL